MGFDEFFENKRKYQGNYREQNYHDDDGYSNDTPLSYKRNEDQVNWLNILEKIKGNRKLKVFVILAVTVILAIAVLLIIVFMPFIIRLFNYIGQNGLQGVFDAITSFLDKILKGSGK